VLTTVLILTLSAAPLDEPAGDAVKTEVKKMEGTWTFEKVVQNGEEPRPVEEMKVMRLVIDGKTRTVMQNGEVRSKATYSIDPKASPKTIDVEILDGPLKGRTLYGIYDLDGDSFTMCLSLDGKVRPMKLEAGKGNVYQVFKRTKTEKK
jgi:uncharacterized protein (TIGR03067 family)